MQIKLRHLFYEASTTFELRLELYSIYIFEIIAARSSKQDRICICFDIFFKQATFMQLSCTIKQLLSAIEHCVVGAKFALLGIKFMLSATKVSPSKGRS
jgi:hypothetical protein